MDEFRCEQGHNHPSMSEVRRCNEEEDDRQRRENLIREADEAALAADIATGIALGESTIDTSAAPDAPAFEGFSGGESGGAGGGGDFGGSDGGS